MRIAIFGASSQIAKNLICSINVAKTFDLLLYVRDVISMEAWLQSVGLQNRYNVFPYYSYGLESHQAVINFVGVGDPARAAELGSKIFDLTSEYDQLILKCLEKNPDRRYLFLSSGAAYGSNFSKPADINTQSAISINAIAKSEYYSVAKLYAEVRHRALADLPIIDIRIFNYFSRNQDINARFFITDVIRAIKNKSVFHTSPDTMTRDFLHPDDFYQLVICALQNKENKNSVIDCYTREPIEKFELLGAMKEKFGLDYEISSTYKNEVNATGKKSNYYSLNHKAADFGYLPAYSALDTVITEASVILSQ
jgi:nucleoside-diphosphate-sugar epimerase